MGLEYACAVDGASPVGRSGSREHAPAGSSFASKVAALLERTEYRRCETGEDIEATFQRSRYKAYRLHGFIDESGGQTVTDELDETPNCYKFGVFIDGELASTVLMMSRARRAVRADHADFRRCGRAWRAARASSIRPMLRRRAALPVNDAVACWTLRLGLIASVHFDATSCVGVIRDEHTAFSGASSARSGRRAEALSALQRAGHVLRRQLRSQPGRHPEALPFFKSSPANSACCSRIPPRRVRPTMLPTAKYYRDTP